MALREGGIPLPIRPQVMKAMVEYRVEYSKLRDPKRKFASCSVKDVEAFFTTILTIMHSCYGLLSTCGLRLEPLAFN